MYNLVHYDKVFHENVSSSYVKLKNVALNHKNVKLVTEQVMLLFAIMEGKLCHISTQPSQIQDRIHSTFKGVVSMLDRDYAFPVIPTLFL